MSSCTHQPPSTVFIVMREMHTIVFWLGKMMFKEIIIAFGKSDKQLNHFLLLYAESKHDIKINCTYFSDCCYLVLAAEIFRCTKA